MREENSLKKITKLDKIKKSLLTLLGYKEGKKFMIDTQPYIKEYDEKYRRKDKKYITKKCK